MKKIIALIAAVAMALSLAACGGGGRGAGITVDNEVGYDGAYLYVSPTSESQWGDDLLGGQTLANGSTARVQIPPSQGNTYDIRMVDTDGDYWVFMNVTIPNGATVVLGADMVNGVTATIGNQTFPGELQMQGGGTTPQAGTISVAVQNNTSDTLWYGYIADVNDTQWGDALFGSSTCSAGASLTMAVPEAAGGVYDVRFDDSGHDPSWQFGQVPLSNGTTIIMNADHTITVDGQAYSAQNSSGGGVTPAPAPEAGTIAVTLQNNTSDTVWYGYISDTNSTQWGDDLFGSSTCSAGATLTMAVPEASGGVYDVRIDDSGHEPTWQFYGVPLANGATITLNADHTLSAGGQTYQAANVATSDTAPAGGGGVQNGVFVANFTVNNVGSSTVMYLYCSSSTSNTWGDDRLGASTISGGSSHNFSIDGIDTGSSFDICFRDSDGNRWSCYGLDMSQITSMNVNLDNLTLEAFNGTSSLGSTQLQAENSN
ncbi:MAG: hypothetical protein IJH73_05510 [Lachnospiraceae bacterium]|nr:hypothetical protein [Lachnospiraceae bacterium]